MTMQLLLVQAGLAVLANGVTVPFVAWLIKGRLHELTAAQKATTAAVSSLDSVSTSSWRTELERQVQGLANGRSTEAARAARGDLRLRQLEAFAVALSDAMHTGGELPTFKQTPIDATGAIGL